MEYLRTEILPREAVEAVVADGVSDEERKHYATALETASNGARISAHDHTIGKLVDEHVDVIRRLNNVEQAARDFRDDNFALNSRVTKYAVVGLALILAVVWLT